MMTQEKSAHVRWMIRRDMKEVLEIEAASFDECWEENDFLNVLRQPHVIGMSLELDEKVVGYIIYELHKKHLSIMNLAISPEHRRRKFGTQLVSKIKNKLATDARHAVFLKLRESNLVAQLFFKSQGFKAYKVMNDYYENNGEAAYCFQYKLKVE